MIGQRKNTAADIVVVGFALFSMFFGAGNVIFPPFLGMEAGSQWLTGFSAYFIADIGLAMMGMFALLRVGSSEKVLERAGKVPAEILMCAIILCIGPMVAIPRTSASTYEMAIAPNLSGVSPVVFSVVFFAVILALCIKESAVVDIVGKVLTPLLLVGLFAIIIKGVITSLGDIAPLAQIDNVAVTGIKAGYQTMDAIARKTESHTDDARLLGLRCRNRMNITAATAHAACTTAKDIGADAILTVSQAGITAQMVSSFRPETTVVALLLEEQVQRQMALYWGVEPITMPRAENTDELVELAVQSAEKAGLIRHGDLVVITAGVPVGISGTTNMIRIQQVGGSLLNAVGVGGRTASGPLCVCRSVEEVAEKFHAGDVLVVPYTTNELLPYLRDAAAIICEEGSAECHAATVGLLLSKPVLVGAGDATRRLEDGVRVSVDCARGVVQTMPQ